MLQFSVLKQQFILQGSGCQKSAVRLTGHMSFGDQEESPYFSCQVETGLIPGLRAWFQHHMAFSSVLSLPLPWSVRTFRVARRSEVLSLYLRSPWSVFPFLLRSSLVLCLPQRGTHGSTQRSCKPKTAVVCGFTALRTCFWMHTQL